MFALNTKTPATFSQKHHFVCPTLTPDHCILIRSFFCGVSFIIPLVISPMFILISLVWAVFSCFINLFDFNQKLAKCGQIEWPNEVK